MPDTSSDEKSDILKIDPVCDTFEKAWRSGKPVTIEELVGNFDPRLRSKLFHHLITLEIELRRQQNEAPTFVEYVSRFPGEKKVIEEVFAETTANHLVKFGDADETHITDRKSTPTAKLSEKALGRYQLLEVIGKGGMGVVHRARDRELNRIVALKMIRCEFQSDDETRARFFREAKAVAQLKHPNIVQIHDIGEWRDGKDAPAMPFIALEFIDGGSLHARLNGEPQPPKKAAEQIRVLADAMAVAHDHKLIHRDLKPANILIASDGTLKLTDFGLVKRAGEESEQTQTGAILGTPSYMAPEQAAGKSDEVGPAADIHALGAILYEMLTGRAPFKGAGALETMQLVRDAEPAPVRSLQPHCPKDLETICLKCLAKDPPKRYRSVVDLSNDLQAFLDGKPIQARPISSFGRALKWVKRHPIVAALTAAVVLITLLGVSGILWQWNEAVSNWRSAQEEARLKGLALNEETKARQAEKSARLEAEENAYWGLIQAASGHLHQDNTNLANAALDECPVHLRNFEWHHLKRRCNAHVSELHVPGRVVDTFFTGDSKTLVTVRNVARGNGRVATEIGLWNVAVGDLQSKWEVDGETSAAALSPDGKRLALNVRKKEGGMTIRETHSGTELLNIRNGTGCNGIAFANDGEILLGLQAYRQVKRWDAQSGKELSRFNVSGPSLSSRSFAFSTDGKRFAILDRFGITHVYDTSSGAELTTYRTLAGRGLSTSVSLRFGADNNHLAFASKSRFWLQDLAERRPISYSATFAKPIDQFEFFPNGKLVAIGESNGLTVFDFGMKSTVARFQGHTIDSRNKAIAISPNEHMVATVGPNLVKIWDMQRSRTVPTIAHIVAGRPTKFSIGQNGQWAAAIVPSQQGRSTNTLFVWKVPDARPFYRISVPSKPSRVALHPYGTEVAVVAIDGDVRFYDTATGRLLRQRFFGFAKSGGRSRRTPFCYSRSGKFFLLGGGEENDPGKIHLWQLSTGKVRSWSAHKVAIQGIAFHPDEVRLVTHGFDGSLVLWNAETQKPIRVLHSASKSTTKTGRMRLSPKGKFLAVRHTGSGAAHFAVWDVESGRKILSLSSGDEMQGVFAFSRDEKQLAVAYRVLGARSGTRVFDTSSWNQIYDLPASGNAITSLAFNQDGKRLFTAINGTIQLWDLTSGRALTSLKGHQPLGLVDGLVFAPTEQRLLAALNNEIVVWNGFRRKTPR